MRRKPLKIGVIAWILAGIYIVGVIVGTWAVCYLLSGSKVSKITSLTYTLVSQYQEHGYINASPMSGRAAIVYDADGQVKDQFEAGGYPVYLDFAAEGQKYVPRVLEGKETYRLVLFARNNTTLGYTSLAYIGIPMVTDGEVTGALFWVLELRDLLEAILAFLCTFTAVFVVVTVFLLLNLHNQRKYEMIRRQYIDNITHELKTPVASIKALAEALSDGMEKSPADRNVYYGMILREANRQERMICDVLELSKLQSYRVEISKQPVSAAEVFAPVCDKYGSLCDLMGVVFSVSDEVWNLPELYTDGKCVSAVMDALLSNAVKFVKENGRISVSAKLSGKRAVICVADNGRGIAKEELPHVFERFYKSRRNDNEAGSGLGLAIARETADAMKEKLWIRSQVDVGTKAYFTISLKNTR